MYIINCPVLASAEAQCDDRLDRAWERERDLLDTSEIAKAIPESDICIPDLADAYVALAEASFALDFVIESYEHDILSRHLSVLRSLAAVAKCASRDIEKVADKIIAERLGVEA